MKFKASLNQLAAKPGTTLKVLGLGLVAIIVLAIAWRILESTFQPVFQQIGVTSQQWDSGSNDYSEEGAVRDMAESKLFAPDSDFAPVPPYDGGSVPGADAEEYEVTEYNGTIKTRDLEGTCSALEALKSRADVIFENANRYDRGCSFAFKVENAVAEEILAIVEGLDPDTLSANTYTIKRLVEDYSNELDILKQKMASIDETFKNAKEAYAEIEALARSTRDAESLATVIESKVQMIERLTEQRINVSEQLDRMQRAMAEQLDRLDYTRFSISVEEDKFVDGKEIRDSWKAAVKEFVRDLNAIVQDLSINLFTTVLTILQYVLYFFIFLVVVRFGWKGARYVWKR